MWKSCSVIPSENICSALRFEQWLMQGPLSAGDGTTLPYTCSNLIHILAFTSEQKRQRTRYVGQINQISFWFWSLSPVTKFLDPRLLSFSHFKICLCTERSNRPLQSRTQEPFFIFIVLCRKWEGGLEQQFESGRVDFLGTQTRTLDPRQHVPGLSWCFSETWAKPFIVLFLRWTDLLAIALNMETIFLHCLRHQSAVGKTGLFPRKRKLRVCFQAHCNTGVDPGLFV